MGVNENSSIENTNRSFGKQAATTGRGSKRWNLKIDENEQGSSMLKMNKTLQDSHWRTI